MREGGPLVSNQASTGVHAGFPNRGGIDRVPVSMATPRQDSGLLTCVCLLQSVAPQYGGQ